MDTLLLPVCAAQISNDTLILRQSLARCVQILHQCHVSLSFSVNYTYAHTV